MTPFRPARALFALLLAAAACQDKPLEPPPLPPPPDPTVISGYTSGTISREGPIRVRFTEPVVEQSAVNVPLKVSPFETAPAIEGVAIWASRQELELRPNPRLKDAQRYRVRLPLKALLASTGKAPQAPLEFEFAAMAQSFSIRINGLEVPDYSKPNEQRLTGSISTADADENESVERMLSAHRGTKALSVRWTHDGNRHHPFTIDGIEREEDVSTLRLAFDGAPIGVQRTQVEEVRVPGNRFTVESASAVQEAETYVAVHFSDPVATDQDLSGLLRVESKKDLKTSVHGNVVRLYSKDAWGGSEIVLVEPGVRNSHGGALKASGRFEVFFQPPRPAVRFTSKGVIVPSTEGLTIPVEVLNLNGVVVEAIQVYESNIPQFLQVNDLGGGNELRRVGRTVWRKTVPIELSAAQRNRWVRMGLDLTPLVKAHPAGLYRLQLSFQRRHIEYACESVPEETAPVSEDIDVDAESGPEAAQAQSESSYWDYSEQYNGVGCWDTPTDPCDPCYYRKVGDHDIRVGRNVLLSDIGLIGKRGNDGSLVIVATDLKSAAPLSGVGLKALDFQQVTLASGTTGADGVARLSSERKPFIVVAQKGPQTGYLRLEDGAALAVGHLDVGGATVSRGLKGLIYGERGVWRPGDTLHLTFLLHDAQNRLPKDHPVRLDLLNSRGQLVRSITRTDPTDGFYAFSIPTESDAPTGNWVARVAVGGTTFEQTLKVETVMPNRLKIELDLGKQPLSATDKLKTRLSAAWLHGAIASHLQAEIDARLVPVPTRFAQFEDYTFDDPSRSYSSEKQSVFQGELDEAGKADVEAALAVNGTPSGLMEAHFTTRVYEPGGAFSSDRFTLPYSPYPRYVGIRTPKGDVARNMLLTDVDHEVRLVAVDAQGKPAGAAELDVRLYKIEWRWWWEKGEESMADYVASTSHKPLAGGLVKLGADGTGRWTFQLKYPEWGRYLVVATDVEGKHRAGKVIYVDWPGWAGRAQKDMPGGGANVLTVATDKAQYNVGETVTLTFPSSSKGRALVSLESGSRVVQTAWVTAAEGGSRFEFKATEAMSPNVYAHVMLLQPHLQTSNDLPMRMFGVAPIKVVNPATVLEPVIEAPEVFAPSETARFVVKESQGRAMPYTVALVAEGLLGLTRYRTPDPWAHFHAREALGVKTWDVFDLVAGANGASLERMLAVGGGDEGEAKGGEKANRFPPLVRFIGPFSIAAGSKGEHEVPLPHYVGAVRLMVVAAKAGAFGSAEKSVFVRKPLMVLATLPRVLGPEEEVEVPVSVFALEDSVKKVKVTATASGPVTLTGPAEQQVSFNKPGDEMVSFRVKVKQELGVASLAVKATSGTETAEHRVDLQVRMPSLRVSDSVSTVLEAGRTWEEDIKLVGIRGTEQVSLEVSRIPPVNLGERLQYLIQYPHGCVEQTTSSVFPQLYVNRFVDLPPARQAEIERNVRAGIARLQTFQNGQGGFGYWPGAPNADDWGSTYAGHFLAEAQRAGYAVPASLLEPWKSYQRNRARGWSDGNELDQAYRLYTLALAGAPELGAMNLLRERKTLSAQGRFRLAAAYAMAGQPEAATALVREAKPDFKEYRELSGTYGSDLRDQAMALETLWLLKDGSRAQPLMLEISRKLAKAQWLSTQETAYALIAMARFAERSEGQAMSFTVAWQDEEQTLTSTAPILEQPLKLGAEKKRRIVLRNTGETTLFPRVIVSGIPALGTEEAAENGMQVSVDYTLPGQGALDVASLEQGTDFLVRVTVANTAARHLQQIALSHLVPSGWEIHNERMDPSLRGESSPFDYRDIRDDRVYTYFDLKPGESKTFQLMVNAAYLGRFYLPMVDAQTMYDGALNGRVPGRWVEVVRSGT